MTHALLPLLDILKNPQNPGFQQAATRLSRQLETFNPANLSEAERTAVLASLHNAMENIRQAQALTGQELGKTQRRATAIQSYSRLK